MKLYKVLLKNTETKAVFTIIEINNEWNYNFFKIVLLAFNNLFQWDLFSSKHQWYLCFDMV